MGGMKKPGGGGGAGAGRGALLDAIRGGTSLKKAVRIFYMTCQFLFLIHIL